MNQQTDVPVDSTGTGTHVAIVGYEQLSRLLAYQHVQQHSGYVGEHRNDPSVQLGTQGPVLTGG